MRRENHLVCIPSPRAGIAKSRDVLLFCLLDLGYLRNDGGWRAERSERVWEGVMHATDPWGEGKSDLFPVTSSRESGATAHAVSQRADGLNLRSLQRAGDEA